MPLEAPISRWQEPVQELLVDYNGNLNIAYYTLIFDNAADIFFFPSAASVSREKKLPAYRSLPCNAPYRFTAQR